VSRNAAATAWHYEVGGRQAGPVTELDIAHMLSTGTINEATLVWSASLGAWERLSGTILCRHARLSSKALPNASSGDRLAWFLALAPIIGALLGLIFNGIFGKSAGPLWWPLLVLNFVVVYMDEHRLKRAGLYTPDFAPAPIVPWYLFSRARAMNEQPLYAIVWIIAFFISIAIFISCASQS
jgi:hypothetical protein